MLAVEGVAASFKTWYAEVDAVRGAMIDHVNVGARDVEAAAAETRRVEEAGKAEVERLRVGVADLRAYYEEEVERLHGQVTRVRRDAEARVKDLSAENDALRRALSTKMTRAEGEARTEEMRAAREACRGETEAARDAVDRHRQRWERDVTKVHEELKRTDDECRARMEGVVQRLEDHTSNDAHRTEKIWDEVQEANRDFVSELDALGGRQRELEQRWQEANELLRGESRREPEEAWGPRGEENDAASPSRARSSGGQKSLAQFRALGAAQLLFGKIGRAHV